MSLLQTIVITIYLSSFLKKSLLIAVTVQNLTLIPLYMSTDSSLKSEKRRSSTSMNISVLWIIQLKLLLRSCSNLGYIYTFLKSLKTSIHYSLIQFVRFRSHNISGKKQHGFFFQIQFVRFKSQYKRRKQENGLACNFAKNFLYYHPTWTSFINGTFKFVCNTQFGIQQYGDDVNFCCCILCKLVWHVAPCTFISYLHIGAIKNR